MCTATVWFVKTAIIFIAIKNKWHWTCSRTARIWLHQQKYANQEKFILMWQTALNLCRLAKYHNLINQDLLLWLSLLFEFVSFSFCWWLSLMLFFNYVSTDSYFLHRYCALWFSYGRNCILTSKLMSISVEHIIWHEMSCSNIYLYNGFLVSWLPWCCISVWP